MPKRTETTFIVSLDKGLANRHRLPLQHVIEVLRELNDAVKEVGKGVQRERGIENADGDFGIDLLATEKGFVFRKGSIQTEAAITRDVENGTEAVRRVMRTMTALERKRPSSIGAYGEPVMRRLASVADIQKADKVELKIALRTPKTRGSEIATYGERGVATIESISAAETSVHGVTIYGRLRELRDKSRKEEGGRWFWGELIADNGAVWRVRFKNSEEGAAVPLFRKRVVVNGDATYYRIATPKLDASTIKPDTARDYEAAFDELYGCDAEIYGNEKFENLLTDLREA
jgi:hypothetical protein